MEMFTAFFIIAFFCFTVVFWIKRGENKYRFDKTRLVDEFIKKHEIEVSNFYSGIYCDLINDETNRSIWFFVLEQFTLKYKQIPYDDLFYIALKYDSKTIDAYARHGEMKREMLGGKGINDIDLTPFARQADIKIVKDISLTIIVDDRDASTVDALFVSHPFFVHSKQVKDAEAHQWFKMMATILKQTNEKLLQQEKT